ncbi:hypothetical protein GCK72_007444 [Caenorhabditis remanei]|uniref:BTB domain-containing protein n=1 Tax=Caenorhabditis remanei TaxID=31234 RepID=A0A6A5HJ26_CAERE|nr:hypothetical protein GCK72_007444 [Caenorhabditis remanei]KAF1767485.1 hypothetical protein GCK72_007444 [Caenorhabditis remanei]
MPDIADDANNRNDLMSKFQKLQSETNEIQSIFSKQSSFDATSLSGNKMLKDLCETMIRQQNEHNKFNEELLKTMKDQNTRLTNRQNEQNKFNEGLLKTNTELKHQSEQVLKEIRSIKSDFEESKKQHSLEIQSMKKLMSVPDSADSSLFPDTSVKNDTSASVIGKEFVLKHVFENVSEIGTRPVFSEEAEHFNIPCIVSNQGSKKTRECSNDFGNKKDGENFTSYGWITFLDWEIMEEEYANDGKLQVEIRVKITKTTGLYGKPLKDFDERNKSFSDVVIVVKERKFYVFKLHLAAQSVYFKWFLSEISPNGKVELNDIESEEFQVFLEVLYGEPAINEKTVEVILYMAKKYVTHAVTAKCEEFLIDESEKKLKKKLQLAIKYKLEKLKMSDTTDDANNPKNLMSKFQKLQSETNEIQSIFSKQSSFDATSLSGNKLLKDICESMINRENEQNKFNEELLKTMKDQNTELTNWKNEQEKFNQEVLKTNKEMLKEIRSMKLDLEESKKQHLSDLQSMKKFMSPPDSADSSEALVYRNGNFMAFYLNFPKSIEADEWSAQTNIEYSIVSNQGTRKTRECSKDFGNKKDTSCSYGWSKFIDWGSLEKDFIVDGKLRAEISVKITKTTGLYGKPLKDFDERNKSFSDVVIVVKERKFYVFKLHLAAQSVYFKSFLSEISPNGKVELSDIESEDFQVYLEVLYGEPAINEKTVEVVLYMAEKYDTHAVTKKCEQFLIDESGKKMKKKLQLATKYKLEQLKEHCLDNINTAADIRSVVPSEISDMDPSTMASLFQKSLAFLG